MSEFADWLIREMTERGPRQVDLARLSNLDKSSVCLILNDQRLPSSAFCRGVAKVLNLPEYIVFERAGLIKSYKGPAFLFMEEMNYLLSQLSEEKKEIAKEIIQTLLRIENDKKAKLPSNKVDKP